MSKPARLTLKVLAAELGLSTCTVSRVLNGKGLQHRIAEDTNTRVLEYARKRGFAPNLVARGLRMKKTNSIGLVLPDLSNPFFSRIARGVADFVHKQKYTLEVCDTQDSIDLEIESISLMRDRQVDGLILCPVGSESEHLQSLATGNLPVVLVDRYFADLKLPYISSANVEAAESATLHLLEHGHREIICLQGMPEAVTNVNRLKGFRQALKAYDIQCTKKMIAGDGFHLESGYRATCEIIEQNRKFTALLCLNSPIALGAMKALDEASLKIPEDVSLVTFDSIEGVEYFATPLTTVYQPARGLGERAVTMLFERINDSGGNADEHILLPTTLTPRKSVRQLLENQ